MQARILGSGGSRKYRLAGMALLCALGMLLGFANFAFAQTTTGTITGTVVDAKGAAMTGVDVAVHNIDTGVDTPVKTNDSGIYNAPVLPPGNYEITTSQTGFATVQHKGLTLQVGQTLRIDIEMPVASQQSLVTVTTEAPLIETEKTEQSQTISESLVSDLPTSSRRWEQFVLLTPGVVSDGPVGGMSFHGLNALYNSNSVDGANNKSNNSGAARGTPANDGYLYSADSIREFQVSSGNTNADLGQSAGGAVNAVTRSGTNAIHGDLFYNMRNPIFNALDPVIKTNAAVNNTVPSQSVRQQNQFGGSLGGPLLKDKLFYFVTYDGYRKNTPISYTTSQVNPPISAFGCPAPITAAQCTDAKNYILVANLGTFSRVLQQDVALGKLDYQVTQANHLNAVFNWRDWKIPNGTATANVTNGGVSTAGVSYLQNRFLIATWNTVIGSDKVNQVLYQYGRDHSFGIIPGNNAPPNVTLTGLFGYGLNGTYPGYGNEDRHQVSDTFSFTMGRHSFKTGVDMNFIRVYNRTSMNISGRYQYSTAVAMGAACPAGTNVLFCDWVADLYGANVGDGKTGQHWTSFAQGKDQRFPSDAKGQFFPAGGDDFNEQTYGAFISDSWKLRSNLTVNLGLRYDLQNLPQQTNPNTSLPILALYTSTVNIEHKAIQPRVGIAWNFAKNTVLRVSFGSYFAETIGSTVSSARRSTGTREQQFNCQSNSTAAPCGDGTKLTLTFPNVFYAQQTVVPNRPYTASDLSAAQQPLTPVVLAPAGDACFKSSTCNVRGLSPDLVPPRSIQGSVGIERQLPGNIGLTVSYIMTRGVHEPAFADANLQPATLTKTYDVVNSAGVTQLTSAVPFFTTRIEPLTGAVLVDYSILNSWYHGVVISARKPVSHGFQFLTNYTVSKTTDDGQASYPNGSNGPAQEVNFNGPSPINPYDWKAEQALSGLDVRNRFTASIVWAPTFTRNISNIIERKVFDGWSIATTVVASNGSRYTGQVQGTGVQCSLGVIPTGKTCATAGGLPAANGGMSGSGVTGIGTNFGGRVAWLPRDSFVLPSYSNVDLRIEKQFTFRERFNLAFRAEAFNLFNSTIVQAVDTNYFNFSSAVASTAAAPTPSCWSGVTASGPGPAAGTPIHANTCMTPVSTFQNPTTTTGVLLGARQLQFGFRFEF